MTEEINSEQDEYDKELMGYVVIPPEEYERLKALDENVKQMIKDLNVALGVNAIIPKYNEYDKKAYEHFLRMLESLYKTKS